MARLQDDLRRTRVEPFAWVVNRSLAATGTRDPVLAARAAQERRQVARVRASSSRLFVVPWRATAPVGAQALRELAG